MPKVLCIGLDPDCRKLLAANVADADIVERAMDIEMLAEEQVEPAPGMVFCGTPAEGVSSNELAQMLSMQYQGVPVYYFVSTRLGFDRKTLHKNGFTDGFLYPIDAPVVSEILKEAVARWSDSTKKVYKQVKLIDITAGVELDFDTYIYLPVNKKYIKFSASGDPMDEDRVNRLKTKNVGSVHVTSDQIKNFYNFTARQLKRLGNDKGISETERRERMQTAVRDLMGGIFNDAVKEASTTYGKSIVADAHEIVKSYILDEGSGKNSWYERISALSESAANAYSHAATVSTFAALFSMGTGVGKPDDLAIAGILHDIGLTDISPEIQMKSDEERSQQERIAYNKHVESTLEIIRDRKLIVSDLVLKIIGQHHERFNGTGYPKGIVGDRICKEAQLLALADEFTYRLMLHDGTPRMSPLDALNAIQKENAIGPKAMRFDLAIVKRLAALFPEELMRTTPPLPPPPDSFA